MYAHSDLQVIVCDIDNHTCIIEVNKGALAIRRIFSLVEMITKPEFSNCPNIFKIGLFR